MSIASAISSAFVPRLSTYAAMISSESPYSSDASSYADVPIPKRWKPSPNKPSLAQSVAAEPTVTFEI